MNATSSLRWLVRALVFALLAEAVWRFALIFVDGQESGLTGYLLTGLPALICGLLLAGEASGRTEYQATLALQLVVLNGFFLGLGFLAWSTGNLDLPTLATGAARVALCACVWAFFRKVA